MNHYDKKLNPDRRLKTPKAIKGECREISITHNPSTIAANQKLFVKFPQLGSDDAIVPGTAKLAFKVDLEGGSDENRVVYNNLAHNLVKEINVRLQGHTIVSYGTRTCFTILIEISAHTEKTCARNAVERQSVPMESENQGVKSVAVRLFVRTKE